MSDLFLRSNSLISGVFCVGIRFRVWVLDQYREVTLPYRRLVSDACHNIEILITHHNSLILALLKPPFLRLALLLGLLPLALRRSPLHQVQSGGSVRLRHPSRSDKNVILMWLADFGQFKQ